MPLWSRWDRLRRRLAAPSAPAVPTDAPSETALRARLNADPNDVAAFATLAEVVRTRAHDSAERPAYPRRARSADPGREADDAVWALAEELAHSPRAWFPLIEMARLSIDDDRGGAMRRLGTAAERDPSGEALVEGVAMLRRAGHPTDALNLGVGHWRPREHTPAVGRHLVEAALETGRAPEARRHLAALAGREDAAELRGLLEELEQQIKRVDRGRTIDLRTANEQVGEGRPGRDR
ncbi:MAG: hypothetical protein U0Q15_12210 [Kineosporiaceae bacterium]